MKSVWCVSHQLQGETNEFARCLLSVEGSTPPPGPAVCLSCALQYDNYAALCFTSGALHFVLPSIYNLYSSFAPAFAQFVLGFDMESDKI